MALRGNSDIPLPLIQSLFATKNFLTMREAAFKSPLRRFMLSTVLLVVLINVCLVYYFLCLLRVFVDFSSSNVKRLGVCASQVFRAQGLRRRTDLFQHVHTKSIGTLFLGMEIWQVMTLT